MPSLTVDFAKEKEAGYQRIFSRSPLYSSVAANWEGLYVAYDYLLPGQTPEVSSKQHGIAIFVDLPTPTQAERKIDGQFRCERVVRGDMVVVPAQAWQQTTWDAPGGIVIVGLELADWAKTISETLDRDRLELIPHFATPDPLVYQIGLALKRALENSASTNRLYAETMTSALMVHLLQHYTAERPQLATYSGGLSTSKLQQVTDYIDAYLDRNLSLRELAGVVQMSPHYFCQLFKRSTGLSPHQYVIRCRIERAKELLSMKQQSIAQVAKSVGFTDQSHFHRHFKRLTEVTPKVFLQQK
jgi:AraC family transcriptional regulator